MRSSIEYRALFLIYFLPLVSDASAMQSDGEGEKTLKVRSFTKSFIPDLPSIDIEKYPLHKVPEGPLEWDDDRKMYYYEDSNEEMAQGLSKGKKLHHVKRSSAHKRATL